MAYWGRFTVSALAGLVGVSLCLSQKDTEAVAVDVSDRPIPRSPLKGSLWGKSYVPKVFSIVQPSSMRGQPAQLIMQIRATSDIFSDGFTVFIQANPKKPLTQQVFRTRPLRSSSKAYLDDMFAKNEDGSPRSKLTGVQVNHEAVGKSFPDSDMYSDRFSGCLRIDNVGGGFVEGRIALEIPDGWHTRVAGAFRAKFTVLPKHEGRRPGR